MCFAESGPRLRLLAFANNLRARLSGVSFGDQAQFYRREALTGFPPLALMEDVELALRLKEAGGVLLVPGQGVRVRARRWRKPGFGTKVGQVVWLLGRFLARRRLGLQPNPERDYRAYYGRPPAA